MLWLTKDWRSLIYTTVIVGTSVCSTFLLFGLMNMHIGIITVLAIPIVLILSLSDAVHLYIGFTASKDIAFPNKMKRALEHYFWPSFVTTITTAFAFLAFLFNASEQIKALGIIVGIAVFLAWGFTYLLSPMLFKTLRFKPYSPVLEKWAGHIQFGNKLLAWGFAGLFMVSLFLLPHVRMASQPESFFPAGSSIKREHDILKEQFYSSLQMEIAVHNTTKNALEKATKNLVKSIRDKYPESTVIHPYSKPESVQALSFKGVRKQFNKAYHLQAEGYSKVIVRFHNYKEAYPLTAFVKDYKASGKTQLTFTGSMLILDEVNAEISEALLTSMGLSLLVMLLMFLGFTRSLKVAAIALWVNLIPFAALVIAIQVFDIQLNALTALVAVMCLGIMVDDTVHVLYRTMVRKEALSELAHSMLLSSILLSLGFAAFGFSSFIPSKNFGLLSALVFAFTVLCDLGLLPYLLKHIKR